MGAVVVCDHPLIQHKLTRIRDVGTSNRDFRELVNEVGMLMAYEVMRDLPIEPVQVQTPVATTEGRKLSGKMPALVPILRAGLGMLDGVLHIMPAAKVGHIGLYRNEETLEPVEYYIKLPTDATERELIVIDPMLATGGSANAAIHALKRRGCLHIKLMCLLASPEGVEAVQQEHPDVTLFVAAIDERLNEHGYIVPGLGDAGDRLFGTN